MYIRILLARVFVQMLRLFRIINVNIYFIIYFSLYFFCR